MGRNIQYQRASQDYTNAIDDYTRVSTDFYQDAYKNSKKYVGDEGYNRALELGKKGAISASNASIANSINNARASGMNKAQSATMGNQSAINTYNTQLNNQQANAYASGQDAVTNEYNKANGISGTFANRANLQGNKMSSEQAEGNNRYNRIWGTIGGMGGLLTSDERLKKYRDLSTSFCSKKDDDILKYKVDITKYRGEE